MSCHSKEELEQMLEDVVNVLDLSEDMIAKHGPMGTSPAELVRMVLEQKDQKIRALQSGMVILTTKQTGGREGLRRTRVTETAVVNSETARRSY